jgi:protein associated with RNAse G/E
VALIGSWLKIQSYKHDGSLHRSWERNYVLEDNQDFFITASKKTKVIEATGRSWFSNEPAICFFSKQEWFNVIAMLKKEGVVFYINIATPTLLDQGILKYIDYDLDYKLFPDGYIATLDESEYEKHKVLFSYSQNLQKVLSITAKRIYGLLEKKAYPFDIAQVQEWYKIFSKKVALFFV